MEGLPRKQNFLLVNHSPPHLHANATSHSQEVRGLDTTEEPSQDQNSTFINYTPQTCSTSSSSPFQVLESTEDLTDEQHFVSVTASSSSSQPSYTPQGISPNHSSPIQVLFSEPARFGQASYASQGGTTFRSTQVQPEEIPQGQNFIFVTESTSKRIHSHITSQQQRRKRAVRRKAVSIHSSTAAILQTIRNQPKFKGQDRTLKLSPRLLPPTVFQESENFLRSVSTAFTCSLPLSHPEDEPRTVDFSNDLHIGFHHWSRKETQLAVPIINRGFQRMKIALTTETSYSILGIFLILFICFDLQQKDLYCLFSRYTYQLSSIVFGSNHPVTILTKLIYSSSNDPTLFESSISVPDQFHRAWMLFHDDAVTAYGTDDNSLAYTGLRFSVLYSGHKLPSGKRTINWDDRLFELGKSLSDQNHYIAAKRHYADYLWDTRGEYQRCISFLEELYAARRHEPELNSGWLLAEKLMAQGNQDCTTTPLDDLSHLARVTRAREILQTIVETALQRQGPKGASTVMAIEKLAAFNRENGAIAEAKAGVEFVVKQFEEFNLKPGDEQFLESGGSKW